MECGYVEVEIGMPLARKTLNALLLVVPDTCYGKTVPVILGTNILCLIMQELQQEHGIRYAQTCNLGTPWQITFKCINVREREARKVNGKLCILKSAMKDKVVIPSNTCQVIKCKLDKRNHQVSCLGIVQPLKDYILPADVEVAPALLRYDDDIEIACVTVSNLTSTTVVVPPSSTICQLQSCDIQTEMADYVPEVSKQDGFINKSSIPAG